jgi:hypothetical protein
LGYRLEFVVSDPQIALGVGNTFVIEFVYDEHQAAMMPATRPPDRYQNWTSTGYKTIVFRT